METQQRTAVKAILWTLLGFLAMSAVGLAFTGSLGTGGAMALVNSLVGLATYVLYERIWARIPWGRA